MSATECDVRGPCTVMRARLGGAGLRDAGKTFIGSMRVLGCPDCKRALPDAMTTDWHWPSLLPAPVTLTAKPWKEPVDE